MILCSHFWLFPTVIPSTPLDGVIHTVIWINAGTSVLNWNCEFLLMYVTSILCFPCLILWGGKWIKGVRQLKSGANCRERKPFSSFISLLLKISISCCPAQYFLTCAVILKAILHLPCTVLTLLAVTDLK